MSQKSKSKAELLFDNSKLHTRIAQLEAAEDERQRAKETVTESETRLRRLVAHFPLPILLVRSSGEIEYVNRKFEEVLGYTKEDLPTWEKWIEAAYPDPDYRRDISSQWASDLADSVGADSKPREYKVESKHSALHDIIFRFVKVGDGRIFVTCEDITDSKRAEETLRKSEARYQRMTQAVTDYFFTVRVDNGRAVETVHGAACVAVTGYTSDDFAADPYLWLRMVDAPDRQAVIDQVRLVLEGQEVPALEHRIIRKDGFRRWVRNTPVQHFDSDGKLLSYDGLIQDITERKLAEQALRESEAKYRKLIENQGEGIGVVDWDEKFVFVNPAAERIFGVPKNTLVGRNLKEFMGEEQFAFVTKQTVKRRKGEESRYELEIIRPDGERRDLLMTVTPQFDLSGQITGAFGIFRDISDQKRADVERHKLEAKVQQVQKLESLGVLAGGIAHDFNNLLMAILGNLDLSLRGISSVSPIRENLQEAVKASQRAADLCRQMLAYSGRGRFIIRAVDLSEVIREMGHMLEVSISKKATLKYQFADALHSVEADVSQIRQIIMNLVINASEAIGDKPGVITLSTGELQCDRSYLASAWLDEELPEGNYVYLEVTDSGCGMDAETLPKIFDPFFTTKFTGRGLGLAAVLGIVRGHMGAIKVLSEKEKGATFRILLPAVAAIADHVREKEAPHPEWHSHGAILLVDDDEAIQALGREMLGVLGFKVRTAGNGRDAAEILRKDSAENSLVEDRIVCVLLDLTMPQMDGEETFYELCRIRPDIRVILSSGYEELDVTGRFAGRRPDGYIQKPYQIRTLEAKLRHVLAGIDQ